MAGYTRNDTANNIADGNIINASDLDGEFDAVQSAFNASTGHTHDGTSGEGAPIEQVGPVQDLVITASEVKPKTTNTLDLGTSLLQYKDLYIEGSAYIDGLGESMLVAGSSSIQFRDTALAINSSADGQLDIDADTELELTAPIVDINASTSVNISNDLKLDSDSAILSLGADSEVTLTHLHNVGTELKVVNATTSSVTDILDLQVESSGTPAVGIGTGLTFSVETAGSNVELGGAVRAIATGLTPTAEEIDLVFYSMRNGSLTEAFRYDSAADRLEITGGASVTADVNFGDNDKAIFGAGSDLQIYHDGTNSRIDDAGAGRLIIRGDGGVSLEKYTGETMAVFNADGASSLYYDNSAKLATTNTGIDVTGTVTADGLTVDADVTTQATVIALNGTSFADEERLSIDFQRGSSEGVRLSLEPDGGQTVGDFVIETGTFGSTSDRLRIEGNGDISFYEDTGTTAKFFWDASLERLGLGTTSPGRTLTVNTGTNNTAASFTSTDANCNISFVDDSTTSDGYVSFGCAGDDAVIRSGNSEAMRIDSSGNVDVAGTITADGLTVDAAIATIQNNDVDNGATLRLDNLRDGSNWGANKVIGTLEYTTTAETQATEDVRASVELVQTSATTTYPDASALQFNLTSANTKKKAMEIASNGDISFYEDTGTTPKLFWDASEESLGIGTSSPFSINGTNLEVSDALYARVILDSTAGTRYSIQSLNDSSLGIYDLDADTERLRIDSIGNLGIGTDSPSDRLEVQGATGAGVVIVSSGDTTITGNDVIGQLNFKDYDADAHVGGDQDDVVNIKAIALHESGGASALDGSTGEGYALSFSTSTRPSPNAAFTVSEAMRIDSSGRALIGYSSSVGTAYQTNLQVKGSSGSNYGGLGVVSTNNEMLGVVGVWSNNENSLMIAADPDNLRASSSIVFTNDGSERMRIDSSGNVGIGTSSPVSDANYTGLTLSGSTGSQIVFQDDGTTEGLIWNSNALNIEASSTNPTVFRNNGSESMRIDSSGKVGIGQTVYAGGVYTGAYLTLAGFSSTNTGNIPLECYTSSTATRFLVSFSNPNAVVGSISTSGSATSYNTSSDYRLKENVVDMTGAVDRVKALNPSQFNFIADPDRTVDGFLAHEVADVVPEAVTGTKDAMQTEEYEVTPAVLDDDGNVVTEAVMGTREVPDYQGIDQSKLVPLLTGALQEAIARIETLEAEVATLKGN